MRQKQNGFTNFMKQIEGDKHDHFSETEGLGFRVHPGYEWLLELLQSRICFGTYLDRIKQFSYPQRLDMYDLRLRIGLNFPACTMGVYVTDRSFYLKAVEYLREHQSCEQQERLPASTYEPVSLGDSQNIYISSRVFERLQQSPSASS